MSLNKGASVNKDLTGTPESETTTSSSVKSSSENSA